MEAALTLFEHILHNAKPNQEALTNLVQDVFKYRENVKSNMQAIMPSLVSYGIYGTKSPAFYTQLSQKELNALAPDMLINKLKEWVGYKQFAIYYGPQSQEKVVAAINKIHNPKDLKSVAEPRKFPESVPGKDHVYVVHYETPQVILYTLSFGEKYQRELSPYIRLYNEYFGGSMSSIVFQELREASALAYGAG
jgi:predicted Zn-dependent peptidase